MPSGFLVQLGDGVLDAGDSLSTTAQTFTVAETLGSGSSSWDCTYRGYEYNDVNVSGTYYLGSDGNVYFSNQYVDRVELHEGSVTSAPSYSSSDNVLTGDDGDDVIDDTFTDEDGEQVDGGDGAPGDNNDVIDAGGGDDQIAAGLGNDTIYGGSGSDTAEGGDGDDVIQGDGNLSGDTPAPVSINEGNFSETSNGYTVTAQNVEGGALTSASSANISTYSGGDLGPAEGCPTVTALSRHKSAMIWPLACLKTSPSRLMARRVRPVSVSPIFIPPAMPKSAIGRSTKMANWWPKRISPNRDQAAAMAQSPFPVMAVLMKSNSPPNPKPMDLTGRIIT